MIQEFDFNDKMREAYDLIENTSQNVFITGKAGTGKTTFLHYLKDNCKKNIVIVAPTGIAAVNAGGTTIHSQFGLPLSPYRPSIFGGTTYPSLPDYGLKKEKIGIIKAMDTLVIDEISMCRADTLDAVNDALCVHRKKTNTFFGGVQIVMIGDLFQLSPVLKAEEAHMIDEMYQSNYFFDSYALKGAKFKMVEFNKIYRQTDQKFIEILNEIRMGKLSEENYEILSKQRYSQKKDNDEGAIVISTHNKDVDMINSEKLKQISCDDNVYECKIDGDFPDKILPCEKVLNIKQCAQVMLLTNNPNQGYYNGTIGKVAGIGSMVDDKNNIVPSINVITEDGRSLDITQYTWDNFKYTLVDGKIEREKIGSCTQFPLKLAWAVTVHKSQGLTFNKVKLDVHRTFAPGQLYVALSRCRTLEGIRFISMFSMNQVRCDDKIKRFFRDKRNEDTEN